MENHAPMGRMMALATRYEVSTQVASSGVADRLPAMCGSATLATLVSSTSMKVASITVMATIHGLITGRNGITELLGVERLQLADAVRQVGPRLVITVEGGDLVVAGARQPVLRLNHFHVVGDARLKAVAGLFHFLARQLDAQFGDVHLAPRAAQLSDGGLDVEHDAVAHFLLLLLQLADGEFGAAALRLYAPAGEERHVEVGRVAVDRDGVTVVEPLLGPEAADRNLGQPGIRGGAQFQLSALLLGQDLAQLGASLPGALQGLIEIDFRGLEEDRRVGQFDALFGIDVEQPGQTVKRGLQLGAGHDQALLLILKLHIGAQGIDAGADAVLLQIGRLIVYGLRQIDARPGGIDIGGGALAAEILRHQKQHALLANGGLLGARGIDAGLAGAIAAPEREIQHRGIEAGADLLVAVRSNVLGEAGDAETEGRFQVGAVDGLAGAAADLRSEGGAREIAFLLALRHAQIGQNHPRILFERQLDGVAQGELEGRGILGESAGSERQEYRNPQLHGPGKCTRSAKDAA